MPETQTLSPEQMRLVIEAADLAVWDWQVQSGKMFFNRRWAEMIGYSIEELLPLSFETWEKLVHPDDIKKAVTALDLHFADHSKPYRVEFRMKTKQGNYHWILSIGKSIEFDDLGQTTRMLGVHIDTNFIKQSEKELETKTKLLEESQKISKVGAWELDIDSGDFLWTDESFRIFGVDSKNFTPSIDALINFYEGDSQLRFIDAINAAINEGNGFDLILEICTKAHKKIDVRTTCVVTLEEGRPRKLTGTFQEISLQISNLSVNADQT